MTEDVFSIGGAEVDSCLSEMWIKDVVFDAKGNLVVWWNSDRDDQEDFIVVVAPDGSRSHDLSERASLVMAMNDGRLAVYDRTQESFLMFGPDGTFLEQQRVGLIGLSLRPMPDGRILTFGGIGAGPGRPVEVLTLGAGSDTSIEDRDTLVMAWGGSSAPFVVERAFGFGFRTNRRHFVVPLLVDALSDGRVAVVDSVGYRIKLLSPSGTVESVLERAIPLRRENHLPLLTFAVQIPVEMKAMGVDSEDRIWVSRTGGVNASDEATSLFSDVRGLTDVFSADGQYMGTLAPDQTRIPRAFGPDGLMAYVEGDGRLMALRRRYAAWRSPVDTAKVVAADMEGGFCNDDIVRVIRLLRLEVPGNPSG